MSRKLSVTGLLSSIVSLALILLVPVTVSAHVTVKPAEVLTAGFQTFTVGTPNEKGVPYSNVKLLVPAGLKHVTPGVKDGWQIDVEKTGEGEAAVVKSITWSGNSVQPGFREDFTFSAQAPAEAVELQWKAYQTYDDGVTVAWDLTEAEQPKKADGSPDFSKSGPFSVTKVAAETESDTRVKDAEQAAADAKKTANRALNFGIAGILVGLAGLYFATRKKK